MLLEDSSSGGDVEDLDDSSIVLFGVVMGVWGILFLKLRNYDPITQEHDFNIENASLGLHCHCSLLLLGILIAPFKLIPIQVYLNVALNEVSSDSSDGEGT